MKSSFRETNKWKNSDNVAQFEPNSNLTLRFKKIKSIFLMVRVQVMCKSEPLTTAGGF